MMEIISVRFRGGSKNYFFDPKGLTIAPDTDVIVETAQGLSYAKCVEGNHEVEESSVVLPLREVVRIANENDRKIAEHNRRREKEAFGICEKKILEHGLEMKLVSVECSFEGNKIIFFFTAEGRVDFRELVKDLAGVFRTRIELRQIGVRDEAKLLGGLGICGRPLCCSAFLDEFIPVSIKMAKTQNLSLNPTKISGTCGRLMCCLKYEQNAYEDAAKRMPKNESFVDTPDGIGNVSGVDLVREEVQVRLDASPDAPKRYKNSEIRVLRNGKGSRDGIEIPKNRPPRAEERAHEEEIGVRPLRAVPARHTAVSDPVSPAAEHSEEKRGGNRRGHRGGKGRGENRPTPEKSVKVEKAPRTERRGEEKRREKPVVKKSEPVEKLPVRSVSNTTAEKKMAADRAARSQTTPPRNNEGKRPNYRRRPGGRGGNGGAKQGES